MTQTFAVASRAGPPFFDRVASWCAKMLDICSTAATEGSRYTDELTTCPPSGGPTIQVKGAASYHGQKKVEDRVSIGNIIYHYSGNSSSSPKANFRVRPGGPRATGAIVKGHFPAENERKRTQGNSCNEGSIQSW